MKKMKPILMSLLIGLITIGLTAQKVIKNPRVPSNENHSRQIPLKISATITDDGETFFFKWPGKIKIADDGCIFILEKDQLIRLSPEGKFIKNLWQVGQGAGEAVGISNYLLLGKKEIIVHNFYPNKVLRFDGEGNYVSEKRIMPNKYMTLFHQDSDNYYYYKEVVEDTKGKAKVVTVDLQIISASKRDDTHKKLFSFPVVNFALRTPQAYVLVRTTPFIICPYKDNLFFVSHTPEYGIKLIDLNTGKIEKDFNRDYTRVDVTDENKKGLIWGQFMVGKELKRSPTPKYLNDIQSMYFIDDKLWVFTSTVTEKGVLVDVFDGNGKYTDCFYLKFRYKDSNYKIEQNQLAAAGNHLYLIEQNPEGDYAITKYCYK